MAIIIVFAVCFVHIVTAQACFKDRLPTVTIQNYDGPIYVSPCVKCENQCSQLYHMSANNPSRCDCDCTCVSKNTGGVPLPCSQSACVPMSAQVPCSQTACVSIGTQVPCSQSGFNQYSPYSGCIQGSVSLQGTYSQAWQGMPVAYCPSCPDCREGRPHVSYNDFGSLPSGLHSQCANHICQCGAKRSGYY